MESGLRGRDDLLGRVKGRTRGMLPGADSEAGRWLRARAPYSWRMGSAFRRSAGLLAASQWWSAERLAAYQLEKLHEVVVGAAANVPGYRVKFAEHGVGPESLKRLEDMRRFPCLTKEELREAPDRYVSEAIPKERLQYVTSGGTTGAPVGFYHLSEHNDDIAAAFRLTMWRRIGYRPGRPALDLTGSFGGGPLHHYQDRDLLCLSISALDCQRFPSYAQAIAEFRPEFLIGFPSTVSLFAELAAHHGAFELRLRGIITSSEVMMEGQRRAIAAAFGCRVLQWYGMAEYAGFASGCERSDEYHFFPESCYLELLDARGEPVTEEGGVGEIVLTGLHGVATPFIRYRTGDMGVLGSPRCRWCGRNYPLLREISGRRQEFLVARDGRLIPGSALNVHCGLFDQVWGYQFYQERPGAVVLSLLAKPCYEPGATERIRRFVLEKVGGGIELEIRFPAEIPRTGRGKHAFIVQKLAAPGAAEAGKARPEMLGSGR